MNRNIRRLVEGAVEPKPVIIDSRPVEFWRCPHCQQEIHEKHTYVNEGVDYHSDCGGPIKLPPTDWSKIDPKWRALLEPHTKS